VKLGNLTGLLNKLQPAVDIAVADKTITYAHDTYEFADVVAGHNVHLTIERILNESPILNELVEEGKIGIAGAMYDVESGAVEFYEQDVYVGERVVVAKAV
jgi:carbonic anhydrase